MSQYERLLFGWHFVLFCFEFVHQLLAHGLEYGLEKGASKDQCCIVVGQRIAKRWYVAIAKPSGIVDLVRFQLFGCHRLLPSVWRFQFPVVETVQKHFRKVIHGLPILRR